MKNVYEWLSCLVSSTFTVDSTVKQIQKELYKNGPLEAYFDVYEDFLSYKSGEAYATYCSITVHLKKQSWYFALFSGKPLILINPKCEYTVCPISYAHNWDLLNYIRYSKA